MTNPTQGLEPSTVQVHVHDKDATTGWTVAERLGYQLAGAACVQLVAHPTTDSWCWTITPRPSGLAVMTGLRGKGGAAQALQLLAASAVDWGLPGQQLAQLPSCLQAVQRVAKEQNSDVGARHG